MNMSNFDNLFVSDELLKAEYGKGISYAVPNGLSDAVFTNAFFHIRDKTGLRVDSHGTSWSIFSETSELTLKEIKGIIKFINDITAYLGNKMSQGEEITIADSEKLKTIAKRFFP